MPRLLPEDILLRPILSEKSWREMEQGKYTFEVHPDATKPEIRAAVEELFKVKVEKVWTMYRPGKPRRTRLDRRHGRTKRTKRAVVKLAPGHKIEIVG
ncbi:MAG: 50S ribosomal protein L23 [Candidatus Bipolaricaulota bacterium]|nr:50S ribosomal protein L23 [Candidatus Bipolaricaulota bacterium]MCX7844488.1 50S ribosomal protein L23 [Candidatus Bipolaricaulota bacterium]MDW8152188.1 50S ribosomal protein L23 [Candidatus Bipolaricaulota bacterium]